MSNSDFDFEEARERLQHLQKMPENPVRAREKAALQRALLEAAQRPLRKPRRTRSREGLYSTPRPEISARDLKPAREIEKSDDGKKKRVTIRKKSPEKAPIVDDSQIEREHKERLKDIRSMLGSDHRAFS
ncbi:MAG: hypothetical protein GF398_02950 [Chitinivibrionales bacterium]|nr:hypothetical protein [Chitinivibrionales bacterium]